MLFVSDIKSSASDDDAYRLLSADPDVAEAQPNSSVDTFPDVQRESPSLSVSLEAYIRELSD